MAWRRLVIQSLAIAVVAMGCAARPLAQPEAASGSPARGAPKRIVVAALREPDTRPTAQGPARVIQPLVNSSLTLPDPRGARRPMLAETVPSLENGLWKLLPDGRMETVWKLRTGARWHDGAPFSSNDLLFSLQIGREGEITTFNSLAYASISGATAPDAQTLIVAWSQPYVDADALFDFQPLSPLPKHRLEQAYREDKASFMDLPHWTQAYVGTGPFRLREWTPGVSVLLEANPDYVLGRPKLDEIEARSIPDTNTLIANLLAGTVDVVNTLGSIDQGLQVRDQWSGGTVAFNYGSGLWVAMLPQFIDPRPAAITDLRFRRAMVHAIDRQELADTLIGGMSPVAHSFLNPNQPQYPEIEAGVTRYDYDLRRAAELLQQVGYTAGPDGMYRSAAGERLDIELRSGPQDQAAKPAAAIAAQWQRVGIAASPVALTPQRVQDAEYVSTFPAFVVFTRVNDVGGLRFLHSSQTRLPSNNFRVPGDANMSRYMNPEFDALLDTYFSTIPLPERTRALGQIIHHIASQVTAVGLYYNPVPGAYSNRLRNVEDQWPGALITWTAHEWDVKS